MTTKNMRQFMDLKKASDLINTTKKDIKLLDIKNQTYDKIISTGAIVVFFVILNLFSLIAIGLSLMSGDNINFRVPIVLSCVSTFVFLIYSFIALYYKKTNKRKMSVDFFIIMFSLFTIISFFVFDVLIPLAFTYSTNDYFLSFTFTFISFLFSFNLFFNAIRSKAINNVTIFNTKTHSQSIIQDALKEKDFVLNVIKHKEDNKEIYDILLKKEQDNLEELIKYRYKKESNEIIND